MPLAPVAVVDGGASESPSPALAAPPAASTVPDGLRQVASEGQQHQDQQVVAEHRRGEEEKVRKEVGRPGAVGGRSVRGRRTELGPGRPWRRRGSM